MKKRVLQFIGSFHQGGSERQAVNLTRLLKTKDRFEVLPRRLITKACFEPKSEALGLADIPEFPLTSFYNPNFVHQVRRCAEYLREKKIDLVHTHDFYTNVFGMAAATLARVPARIASKRETAGMRSRGQEFVEKIAFGRATCDRRKFIRRPQAFDRTRVPAGKIASIYNGIDLERFANVAERIRRPRGKRGFTRRTRMSGLSRWSRICGTR